MVVMGEIDVSGTNFFQQDNNEVNLIVVQIISLLNKL